MLAIRMQRTGRKGHTQFRVIVQDSHFHPTRGRVVAHVGSYNPHTKTAQIDKEIATKYLNNGAQPSDRVARLLKSEGVKLPEWVKLADPKKRTIRNPEKLRRNRPAEPVAEAPVAEESSVEESASASAEVPAETSSEEPASEPEAPADAPEVPAAEPEAAPAEEPKPEEKTEEAPEAPAEG